MRVSIVGGSGYVGGELLRLLLGHPDAEVGQVTSESFTGKYVRTVHPNLRGVTELKFSSVEDLEPCDFLFLALPHREAMERIEEFEGLAPRLIDLSADFRLRKASDYVRWYGREHPNADRLGRFVYGIPELHREELAGAKYASGAGCNATAVILGLFPLVQAGLIDPTCIVAEAKVGSSEGGNKPGLASHHPERSGAVRSFAPTGHRHVAEMLQELGLDETSKIHFSATAIEMVRGILVTAHAFAEPGITAKDVWRCYRKAYAEEPFMRIVRDRQGVYRFPEPKLLWGSNYCDVGFEVDEDTGRIVVMSAIDNLMKGAAGNGIQAMNLMCGFPETRGIEFPGMHPI
jgi:N-acetyl-gamma-glutamyl-phosphate/LysW-gamma-L-alpha-aminoadipyl-6-phosphate reductase